MDENASEEVRNIRKTIGKLMVVVVLMFSFVFVVMVPLYDVMCKTLGINGKTSNTSYQYQAEKAAVDTSRSIKVQFMARNNDGMEWEFHPDEFSLDVHPGQLMGTAFFAKNSSTGRMTAQAIPSISPSRAAVYFHKTECFCFRQQTLDGKQELEMPLRFVIDQALPADIQTITLTYTLFDVTEQVKNPG